MKALLLALALLFAGQALAQQWSGGVVYRFGGDLTASATIEWPAFDFVGARAGPSVNVRAFLGPSGWGAAALAGFTVAFVPPVEEITAFALDLSYEVIWRAGDTTRFVPSVGLFMAGRF
jgi:hypothetical protein